MSNAHSQQEHRGIQFTFHDKSVCISGHGVVRVMIFTGEDMHNIENRDKIIRKLISVFQMGLNYSGNQLNSILNGKLPGGEGKLNVK